MSGIFVPWLMIARASAGRFDKQPFLTVRSPDNCRCLPTPSIRSFRDRFTWRGLTEHGCQPGEREERHEGYPCCRFPAEFNANGTELSCPLLYDDWAPYCTVKRLGLAFGARGTSPVGERLLHKHGSNNAILSH